MVPVALAALLITGSLVPEALQACVGPPAEPFCTKTVQLAIAGPPVLLLPAGGTFDVSALVYFGLLDFPAGSGICPPSPYTVDLSVTATCRPAGADGAGALLGAAIVPGFNELSVPVTVPAGGPRRCVLAATATVTLADGMVLTESADNVACFGDPAPGLPGEPRLDLRRVGPPGGEIARAHPGDPSTFVYEIVNNDPAASFSGTLAVDSVNESRMPGASGPMPPGTAAVSVSDPAAGDNFPVELLAGDFGSSLGEPVEGCIGLPPDPTDPSVPTRLLAIDLAPGASTFVTVHSRAWGMCADGSCGRSTLDLGGTFSDTTAGLACSGFVTAADVSEAPAYGCDDSGETALILPPPDPSTLLLAGSPRPGVDLEVEAEVTAAFLNVDGIPEPPPIPFAGSLSPDRGRIQLQFPLDAAVDSFFDVRVELEIRAPAGSGLEGEVIETGLEGAPTGFERTAPFASPLVALRPLAGGDPLGFLRAGLQVSAVAIDNLGGRRPLAFGDIRFLLHAGGDGVDIVLGGGEVSPGAGTEIDALEVAMDLRGFLTPTPSSTVIFEDGFESGNVSRWSSSVP